MNIAVIGAGSWGTAMTVHLHRRSHNVTLVARDMDHALAMASTRFNERHLPGVRLHPDIQIGCEFKPALMEAQVVLMACPSAGLRNACGEVRKCLSSAPELRTAIALCKGLESGSLLLPSEVIAQELPELINGVLSGPTFAWEIAAGQPGAAVLASGSDNASVVEELQEALSGLGLRVYRTSDVVGVELGGCLKNVYAIGAGICDGLGLGHNAKAAYVTRSLAELVRIGVALGGSQHTFFGLSGVGDLMATCYTSGSRNYSFGFALGRGSSAEDALRASSGVVEGYGANRCFYERCRNSNIKTPILDELYQVIFHRKDPAIAVTALMSRELKQEA